MGMENAKDFNEWKAAVYGEDTVPDDRMFWEYGMYIKTLADEDRAERSRRNVIELRAEDLD